ncbi:protein phosphatase 2C domain-containing protein [Acrocarpospora sp. B8E8]|uniref:protein phosphatase 2C domain-containing protein n=1 Tax=Acrocarpospora sp. B8E8 TaxID=3153572 RepID=UPI00325DBC48
MIPRSVFRQRRLWVGGGCLLGFVVAGAFARHVYGMRGMAIGALGAVAATAVLGYSLNQQIKSARRQVMIHPDSHSRSAQEPAMASVDDLMAPATPGRAAAEPDGFPRPTGRPAQADLLPWRIPGHPGPSGIAADSALVGDLDLRAASIVGPGHRCEEPATPRQDAYRIGTDAAGEHLIVAVADGMSDSSHSDLGANVAADTIVKRLRDVLNGHGEGAGPAERDLRESLGAAAQRMTATAEQRGLTRDDVRAAVLVAVIALRPDRDGCHPVSLATVADVTAWTRQDRCWRHIAGGAKSGLDAGRLDAFLPHFPSKAVCEQVRLAPGSVLALTTDGIGDALASPDLAAWFGDEWRQPPTIRRFIDVVAFEAKGALDDRTAVVIWFRGRRP